MFHVTLCMIKLKEHRFKYKKIATQLFSCDPEYITSNLKQQHLLTKPQFIIL
jgi:hypothetical protein